MRADDCTEWIMWLTGLISEARAYTNYSCTLSACTTGGCTESDPAPTVTTFEQRMYTLAACCWQGRSDGGGYIGIYTPQKNQSALQIFMWLLVVVFFSLTQDKFDIVPVCALARVPFTYLPQFIPLPQNEIPGYAPDCWPFAFIIF